MDTATFFLAFVLLGSGIILYWLRRQDITRRLCILDGIVYKRHHDVGNQDLILVEDLATHSSPYIRRQVARRLRTNHPRLTLLLKELMRDKDPTVRKEARIALCRAKNAKAA